MSKGKQKSEQTAVAAPSFEAAIARLEEIVERLDDGQLPLEESLALFKEGMALAKRCRSLLEAAELQVKEAMADSRLSEVAEEGDGDSRP